MRCTIGTVWECTICTALYAVVWCYVVFRVGRAIAPVPHSCFTTASPYPTSHLQCRRCQGQGVDGGVPVVGMVKQGQVGEGRVKVQVARSL